MNTLNADPFKRRTSVQYVIYKQHPQQGQAMGYYDKTTLMHE